MQQQRQHCWGRRAQLLQPRTWTGLTFCSSLPPLPETRQCRKHRKPSCGRSAPGCLQLREAVQSLLRCHAEGTCWVWGFTMRPNAAGAAEALTHSRRELRSQFCPLWPAGSSSLECSSRKRTQTSTQRAQPPTARTMAALSNPLCLKGSSRVQVCSPGLLQAPNTLPKSQGKDKRKQSHNIQHCSCLQPSTGTAKGLKVLLLLL